MLQPQQQWEYDNHRHFKPQQIVIAGEKTNTQDLGMHWKPSKNHEAPKSPTD